MVYQLHFHIRNKLHAFWSFYNHDELILKKIEFYKIKNVLEIPNKDLDFTKTNHSNQRLADKDRYDFPRYLDVWELLTNVWEILTNVWEILTNVWEILTNAWEILTNVWEISTKCLGNPN